MSILDLTAVQLGQKIKSKEITSVEAVEAAIKQIKALEPELNCFVTVDEERALKRAAEVQKMICDGILTGPLAGVPAAIKDNMCIEGMLTTCSSKILYNFKPTYTARAVRNLEQAGAVVLGKTNMDEFAMGSTTETSAYGETKNPWNTEHVPGGSSGGSCGAVAANECFFALGSDTGGSIRQPSSFCGVTGLKPTYGTVSRYGLIAYGSSLDQIGPVAKDVTDCAIILEAIASHDKMDSTSVKREDCDFSSALVDDVKGMKIGIPRDYLGDGLDTEVREAVLNAANVLKEKGAVVEEFDLSLVEYAIPAYYVIASAEASSNLSRFDGVKYGYRAKEYEGLHSMYKKSRSEGFGAEVKRRIMLGSFVLSSGYYDAYYLKALKTKALIKKAFDRAFEAYDVILGPAAPSTAPKLGESLSDPLKMYLGDIYTVSVNLAGLPAMTVPCGKDSKGLPIGLQMIGDCFKEKNIIRAGFAFEKTRAYEAPELAKRGEQGVMRHE
ncbi:Asp-tRNA(Asn)/Glu-tRNA(Gln) amidotransferase subunit GatA [Clostridium sp. MCC353]|uniref:Asp-tRNA(Asn)/Glu-tRNA(Gln) amidotransferase subunit GatA n=1 Tax=Clostridium sp. MCC353 TaxID=2592646 RepID=UPI001C013A1C|nr:Asp-tRNA(Asn)/Glu-tRNA(Gln) amidotransferase subunit GatA [Clostridium sp. MCC353]MBT9777875.1 Asp-tRNA(Asn)/Glu-tRNA(Gln) amidotransferase subunit GatA [Clostridium sp. MCC353]